jgi:hypothetical protein
LENGFVQPVEGWNGAFDEDEGFCEIAALKAGGGFVEVGAIFDPNCLRRHSRRAPE